MPPDLQQFMDSIPIIAEVVRQFQDVGFWKNRAALHEVHAEHVKQRRGDPVALGISDLVVHTHHFEQQGRRCDLRRLLRVDCGSAYSSPNYLANYHGDHLTSGPSNRILFRPANLALYIAASAPLRISS